MTDDFGNILYWTRISGGGSMYLYLVSSDPRDPYIYGVKMI